VKKIALITGASSGIGEALAYLLASHGYSLILSGRNEEKLKKIAEATHAEQTLVADLKIPQERQKIVSVIHEKLPELVINNAGFGLYGDAISLSVQEQLEMIEVDASAPLELTLEAARAWDRAHQNGIVMNVSSAGGEQPCPGMSVYGASKAFLTHVSLALNTELKAKGIDVLVSCPGMVATDFPNRASKKKVDVKERRMTPAYAAQQIWKQIEKREEKRVFNWQYRVGSWLGTHFLFKSLIRKLIWNRIKQRL
jgi:uncharacterized protein